MSKMCHPIAVALFDSQVEPMTAFSEHDRALLESALYNPKQTFGNHELYPTLSKKAAILYYGLIKNHPFRNGNKRTATASMLVFLSVNDYPFFGDKKEIEDYLVELATRVAKSEGSEEKDRFLDEIKNWLERHSVQKT